MECAIKTAWLNCYKVMKPNLNLGLSVIVPVYNSEAILPELVERLEVVLVKLGMPFELILVNDGSQDESWAAIKEMAKKKDWIRGFCLMRNFGQHNAVLAGIRAARHEVIVTIDDDLQTPPEEIVPLLARLTNSVDLVYGIPIRRNHSILRNISSAMTRLSLTPLVGMQNARIVSSFRIFRTQLREAFQNFNDSFVSVDVILGWGTQKVGFGEVQHQKRAYGQSSYTFFKLASHAITMFTGFSTWPLRLASLIGMLFTSFGFVVLIYVIATYIRNGGTVPGFPFLASIIAIFSGAQLFALGVIGEYVAKIYIRSMNSPSYAIKETTW